MATLAALGTSLLASGCGGGVDSPAGGSARVASIIITSLFAHPILAPSDTIPLIANLYDAARNQIYETRAVAWTSSDPSIATINARGLVTAVKAGDVIITAKVDDVSATTPIAVRNPSTASLSITVPVIRAGETLPFGVVATDATGHAIPSASVTTSILGDDDMIAQLPGDGTVKAIGIGTATLRAVSGSITATATVTVLAPPRPAGSLLVLVEDRIHGFSDNTFLQRLGMVDTSRTGKDYRVGILRTAAGAFVSRSSYPLLSAIAECPNGKVYAYQNATGSNSGQLWEVNPATATVSVVGGGIDPYTSRNLSCDSSNQLIASGTFGGVGALFRGPPGQWSQLPTTDLFFGVGQAPSGTYYTYSRDPFTTGSVASLRILNVTTGATALVAPSPAGMSIPSGIVFRGNRLIGLATDSPEGIIEINTATAAITRLRTVSVP